MSCYQPPLTLTSNMLALVAEIAEQVGQLLHGLIDDAGHFRRGGVGIYRGERLLHMAPPANRVAQLVDDLLGWLDTTDLPPLLASCVFHYELEFIHPFADGNGRMGRLWQTLILSRWRPVLAWLPVESVIRDRQDAYYDALSAADQVAEATPFVEFMLQALQQALGEALESQTVSSEQSSVQGSEQTPLLVLLAANPMLTARQAAERLGLSSRAVEKQLAALKAGGRLRRIGPNKGGYWQVVK